MDDITKLLSRIHIKANNVELYTLALTHPSYNMDAKTIHHDYERLEYMGDAVLGYVTADLIYKIHPDMPPGNMSKLRSFLVKSSSLANYARRIKLMNYIRTGQSISSDKIAESNKILEDVFEALVGAIYLDKGIKTAYNFISRMLKKDIVNFNLDDITDAKTKLQEALQSTGQSAPSYAVVSTTGPSHDRTFTVSVSFSGMVIAYGSGKSKKEAEEFAAKQALKKRSV